MSANQYRDELDARIRKQHAEELTDLRAQLDSEKTQRSLALAQLAALTDQNRALLAALRDRCEECEDPADRCESLGMCPGACSSWDALAALAAPQDIEGGDCG